MGNLVVDYGNKERDRREEEQKKSNPLRTNRTTMNELEMRCYIAQLRL